MLILFDNVLNHSGLDKNVVEFRVCVTNGRTMISCSNNLESSVDTETLSQKVSQLNGLTLDSNSDLLKLRSEGGSGIAKLHKIVRYELCDDEDDYRIELKLEEDQRFSVYIDFGKELLSESVSC